jgi:outer membrane protein
MAKERDEKIANIKNMEREINEFRQTRERQLQEQAMRMRETIVKEITEVIMERVKTTGYDLVFDKSGPSMNGVNIVLHSKDTMDFTTEVITALNSKPAPATTTTEKPATAPATTAAPKTTAAPATSPKKP